MIILIFHLIIFFARNFVGFSDVVSQWPNCKCSMIVAFPLIFPKQTLHKFRPKKWVKNMHIYLSSEKQFKIKLVYCVLSRVGPPSPHPFPGFMALFPLPVPRLPFPEIPSPKSSGDGEKSNRCIISSGIKISKYTWYYIPGLGSVPCSVFRIPEYSVILPHSVFRIPCSVFWEKFRILHPYKMTFG
jgi:hypothetical protein